MIEAREIKKQSQATVQSRSCGERERERKRRRLEQQVKKLNLKINGYAYTREIKRCRRLATVACTWAFFSFQISKKNGAVYLMMNGPNA